MAFSDTLAGLKSYFDFVTAAGVLQAANSALPVYWLHPCAEADSTCAPRQNNGNQDWTCKEESGLRQDRTGAR